MEDQYKAGILPLSYDCVSSCLCPVSGWGRSGSDSTGVHGVLGPLLLHPRQTASQPSSSTLSASPLHPAVITLVMLSMMLSKYISISTLMPLQYHPLIRHRLNIFIWNNRGRIKPSKSVQLPKSKEGSVLVNLILPRFLSNTRLSISIIDQYCMDVKAVGNNLSAAYLPDSAEVWCLIVLCKPAAASLHTNVGMMECWVFAATATVITSSAKHPKYFHNDFHWSSLMISLALREST